MPADSLATPVRDSLPRMTVAEYLAFERDATTRHEYIHGRIQEMAGGTRAHTLIIADLTVALGVTPFMSNTSKKSGMTSGFPLRNTPPMTLLSR